MIILKKINRKSKRSEMNALKEIVLEAFPREEIPPYCFLLLKTKSDSVEFNGVYDNDKLIGITYLIKGDGIVYLFLLAIKKEERGNGYGSQILTVLKNKFQGSKLILSLEPQDENAPNKEQRKNRHEFYKRNGLQDMPYHIIEASVIYDVMGLGGMVSKDEYKKLMNHYFGKIVSHFVKTELLEN